MLTDPSPPAPHGRRSSRAEPSKDVGAGHPAPAESPAESALSLYFAAYVDDGQRKLRFPLRHPVWTVRAAAALLTLPVLEVRAGTGPDAVLIRRLLSRPPLVRLAFQGVASVLEVPEDLGEYLAGGRKRRLREYVHTAERMGLTYETVESPSERAALLALADERERTNQHELWRKDDPQNEDTLPLRTWVLVRSRDGTPVLLTMAAVDGEWAVLRYSRTLVRDKHSAIARYAAMPYLVEHLRRAGVLYLVDPGRPYWLSNGVRQYQRKVGFRLVRLRLPSGAAGTSRDRPARPAR